MFLIIMIVIPCSGLFRDISERSGMFHVPGFIGGRLGATQGKHGYCYIF